MSIAKMANRESNVPVVIGRGHLDSRSGVASGATWVSRAPRRRDGMGYSQQSGVVIVCNGSEAADRRIARVLCNDLASGVMCRADTGYEIEKRWAARTISNFQWKGCN